MRTDAADRHGGRLVSVVVPAHNEEATVAAFVARTAKAFAELGRPWELVYVDDGSTDGTAAAVRAVQATEPRVRLLSQRRNLGLTEALNRGFREAAGEIIVFLPADLESDPAVDIPLLLGKLDEGYDVVSGWRQGRRDGKRVASRIANWTCRLLFGLDVHDMNWIKAFRREVTDGLAMRSSWHRYMLVLALNEGWRIGEVKVPYQPRRSGRSKFGFSRLPVSFLDVVTLKFLLTFQRKPMLFFGAIGAGMIGAGLLLWLYLAWRYLSSHTQYRPLMLVAGIALLAGLLVVLVGFLAELVVNVSERVDQLERRLSAALAARSASQATPAPSSSNSIIHSRDSNASSSAGPAGSSGASATTSTPSRTPNPAGVTSDRNPTA
jgi:glycosyltransferase involved in cell wall biosynthesis